MTYDTAKAKFQITHSTLGRHVHRSLRAQMDDREQPVKKPNRKPALTEAKEYNIVRFLVRYTKKGVKLTRLYFTEAIEIPRRLPAERKVALQFHCGTPSE